MNSAGASRSRVIIVLRLLPHYRLALFKKMHARLASEGVELNVVYGSPNKEHAAKNDLVELPPAIGIKVPNIWLSSERIFYQPVLGRLLQADLVIMVNGVSYIPTYLLLMKRRQKSPKLGFLVFHAQQWCLERSFKESLRRWLMRRGDWWFAYTSSTRDYLLMNGVRDDRITVLNNSIDTSAFRESLASVSLADLRIFAANLGVPWGQPVGLFCGGLHRKKRLEFLFQSLRLIHEQCPEFHLIVIGNGTCREVVVQAAAQDSRIHYIGASFGREKAQCFLLSKLYLCPGLVGLGILDAFVAGLPLLTTDLPIHSPEIAYLRPGINGLMTPYDPLAYAQAVLGLLHSEAQWQSFHDAALEDAQLYSIEQMAERFSDGILKCLEQRVL